MLAKIKKYIPTSVKNFIKLIDGFIISTINRFINPNFKCTKDSKRCFSNKKSPNYKYEYFGKDTPVCCATHLYEILKDVTEVLEKHNLEYFISFGTLLGAIRHKGFIPWDTDVDILIPESQKEAIFNILQKELGSRYFIVKDREDNIVGSLFRVNYSKNNLLHIDLFTYIEQEDSIVFGYQRVIKKEDTYPLQKIPFYDIKLYAPKNPDVHLKRFYGQDYMKYAYKQWALNKKKFEITDYSPAKIEEV